MNAGSTTAVLVNIPGEAPFIVSTHDGYQMVEKGRAGPVLGILAFGSSIAGTVTTLLFSLLAWPLGNMAMKFGFRKYFPIIALRVSLVCYLSHGSISKALIMALLRPSMSFTWMDIVDGRQRFTFLITN